MYCHPDTHATVTVYYSCYGHRSDIKLQVDNSEAVSVQGISRQFAGILPNIRLSMPNDEH